ncbi:hypothetical protein HMPREF3227_00414 [Corynebacterium sp. CMW7794]|nr:hypothetical protein HMPREF3227_00414 [Corynebacterium sp. CMW7794]
MEHRALFARVVNRLSPVACESRHPDGARYSSWRVPVTQELR